MSHEIDAENMSTGETEKKRATKHHVCGHSLVTLEGLCFGSAAVRRTGTSGEARRHTNKSLETDTHTTCDCISMSMTIQVNRIYRHTHVIYFKWHRDERGFVVTAVECVIHVSTVRGTDPSHESRTAEIREAADTVESERITTAAGSAAQEEAET